MVFRKSVVSDAELDRIADLLRIAQSQLLSTANKVSAINPDALIIERLRQEAEYCADIRERIARR